MRSGRLSVPLLPLHVADGDSGGTLATLRGQPVASLNWPDGALAKDRLHSTRAGRATKWLPGGWQQSVRLVR